jgi:CHAT domain-containing protein
MKLLNTLFAVFFLLLLNTNVVLSQNIPQNPNKIDQNGLRQGKWTEMLDKDDLITKNKEEATFYRIVEYKDDEKIETGVEYQYYLSGNKYFEGRLSNGKGIYYDENGKKKREVRTHGMVGYGGFNINISFHPNGIKASEDKYENERLFTYFYNEKGKLISKQPKDTGIYSAYIINPFPDKTTFHDDGNIASESRYENGKIFTQNYNKNGKKTTQETHSLTKDEEEAMQEYLEAKSSTTGTSTIESIMGDLMANVGDVMDKKIYLALASDDSELYNADYSFSDKYYELTQLTAESATKFATEAAKNSDNEWYQLMSEAEKNYAEKNLKKAIENTKKAIDLSFKEAKEAINSKSPVNMLFGTTVYYSGVSYLIHLYRATKQFEEAKKLYDARLTNKLDETSNLSMLEAGLTMHFAGHYKDRKDYKTAGDLYRKALLIGQIEVKRKLTTSTESIDDKMALKYLRIYTDSFNTLVVEALQKNQNTDLKSTLLPLMYDNQQIIKSSIINYFKAKKFMVLNNPTPEAAKLYQEWQKKREELKNALQMSAEQRRKANIVSYNLKIEEKALEGKVFEKVKYEEPIYTWKDIQKKLKPTEAAVELIYTHKAYVALIVTPNTINHPEIVLLENVKDLEGKYLTKYRESIENQSDNSFAYTAYWAEIAKKLQGIKKVYLSPDGVYNLINLNSLQNPNTKKYVIDEIEIHQLTNTKDLVSISKSVPNTQLTAELIGYPAYQLSAKERLKETQKRGIKRLAEEEAPTLYAQNPNKKRAGIEDLIGTKEEVNKLSSLLKGKKWKTKSYLQEQALEEVIKEVKSPKVLHIATHGYFIVPNEIAAKNVTKVKKIEFRSATDSLWDNSLNPLLRSGLILAGGAETLNLRVQGIQPDKRVDDGILTAYEVVGLDLQKTDLVVLSACETGLGELVNGEGVYGLQRAFQVAGAKSIIMSMWKVDDGATQKLMTSFFEIWTNEKEKLTPREAFKEAQKRLRAEYPHPYYWGAFVMVGE